MSTMRLSQARRVPCCTHSVPGLDLSSGRQGGCFGRLNRDLGCIDAALVATRHGSVELDLRRADFASAAACASIFVSFDRLERPGPSARRRAIFGVLFRPAKAPAGRASSTMGSW